MAARPPTSRASTLPLPRGLGAPSAAAPLVPKMEILPPAILSARPIGGTPLVGGGRATPATRDAIELVSEPAAPAKRRGRPSKLEKLRAARAAASEGIAALLDSKPKRADIRQYFIDRIAELSASTV